MVQYGWFSFLHTFILHFSNFLQWKCDKQKKIFLEKMCGSVSFHFLPWLCQLLSEHFIVLFLSVSHRGWAKKIKGRFKPVDFCSMFTPLWKDSLEREGRNLQLKWGLDGRFVFQLFRLPSLPATKMSLCQPVSSHWGNPYEVLLKMT